MNPTFSPFLQEMQHCRQTMSKLRKKIYKICRNNQYQAKKLKDNTEEIIEIFNKRNMPLFVTQALRKRRNFDLKSIKNIVVNVIIPLQDIQSRTVIQEKEVEQNFKEHKQRLEELNKKEEQNKVLGEVMYQLSTDNIYSSTNEDQYIPPIDAQPIEMSQGQSLEGVNALYNDSSSHQREPNHKKDYFEFNINESSMHQDLAFLNF